MTLIPEWLDHPVALTVLAALVPIGGLLWTLAHLRHEHCRQIHELQAVVRDLIDVADPPEPEDLFSEAPGLSDVLLRYRDEYDRAEQAEQQELAR
jgi:hypothetical protein